jgi:MFS family permease
MTSGAPAQDRRLAVLLLAALATTAFAASTQGAALAEVQEQSGVTTALLGVISFAALGVSLAGQLLLAPYADRGHARRLCVAGLVAVAAGLVLLATASSFPAMLAGRVLCAVALGTVTPAVYGTLAGLDPGRRGRRLALASAVHSAGSITGAFTAALVFRALGIPGTFLLYAVLAVVAAALLSRTRFPPPVVEHPSTSLAVGLLRARRLQSALCVAVACALTIGVFDALWERYVTDTAGMTFDANLLNGLTYLFAGIPYIVILRFTGRLADRDRTHRYAYLAVLPGAACALGYGLATGPWSLVGASFADGSVQGFFDPFVLGLVAASVPPGRDAAAQALASAATTVAALAVGGVSPLVYDRLGPAWMFAAAATMLCLGALGAALGWSAPSVEDSDQEPTFFKKR